ncbi:hypothetical protein AAFF_G00136900 [Aldrovandia affinis]|uniref:Uncharacterized protein n=1 Tax=Aldrovandia affinis TaxID=143900 RepID=A0AAD7TD41_9TELE|nr:hypothetical protein AAFF_G00136900 [Aldrovandia affinis]
MHTIDALKGWSGWIVFYKRFESSPFDLQQSCFVRRPSEPVDGIVIGGNGTPLIGHSTCPDRRPSMALAAEGSAPESGSNNRPDITGKKDCTSVPPHYQSRQQ